VRDADGDGLVGIDEDPRIDLVGGDRVIAPGRRAQRPRRSKTRKGKAERKTAGGGKRGDDEFAA
jgi:hypothetical protein